MTMPRLTPLLLSAALVIPVLANASERSCAAGLTPHAIQFQSAIQYDDLRDQTNPTVYVLINGKVAKMMLDSGSNSHSLWDESLLDEMPSSNIERQHAIVGSGDARKVTATLADYHGNASRQEFYFLTDSALAEDGYAGILSPQAVAGHNAVVIDFEENCFFISPPFDVGSVNGLHVRRGTTIPNPYYVIAIPVELDDRMIPMLVDSGAPITFIQASLLASKPKGREGPRMMDIFKAEIPKTEHTRLVDLKVNGQIIKSLPVIPRHTNNDNGIVNFGYLGMDVLKHRIIYYDGTHHEFNLLTRHEVAQSTGSKREARIE
jgi:hypothetical protein